MVSRSVLFSQYSIFIQERGGDRRERAALSRAEIIRILCLCTLQCLGLSRRAQGLTVQAHSAAWSFPCIYSQILAHVLSCRVAHSLAVLQQAENSQALVCKPHLNGSLALLGALSAYTMNMQETCEQPYQNLIVSSCIFLPDKLSENASQQTACLTQQLPRVADF